MSNNQQLNEGLRPLDLENMVSAQFEIDTYRSKMGEDRDVCVLSFKVKDRDPARDLMEFIEKGYDFVLDSDVSSGENDKGEYFVFVELERTPKLSGQIRDLTYGVKRLTGIDDWEYRYHKGNQTYNLTTESLEQIVPASSREYDGMMNRVRTEEVKRFFTKTLMDDLTIDGDVITIHKPYNQKVRMKLVREGEQELIHENTSALALDNIAMGEIFWLTKVLGDYNINKIGDGFVFENNGKAMILQRMDI
jgi:hypothetical protein